MGTVVSFDVRRGSAREEEVFLALAEARRRLHHADAVFSTWRPRSPMSLVRRGEMTVEEAPPDVRAVLERCELARRVSGGWFDPWAMPGGVDPTGLVKGWAAERALEPLVEAAVGAAMVSAAGDIAVWGQPEPERPWKIGIQDPWNRLGLIGVVEVRCAVATSGVYERGLHVLDPTTGTAAEAAVSATVVGPRLDLADALATALVAGSDKALEHIAVLDGYEGLLIHPDRSRLATPGFTLLS